MLRDHGAETVLFPVLDIVALPADEVLANFDPGHIPNADALIFVSANAVQFGIPLLRSWGGPPSCCPIFAIGQATLQALADLGINNAICPDAGNDSEALLAMPQLQDIRAKHFVLVRGISEGGGRVLLAETLAARGAVVHALSCYRRLAIGATASERLVLAQHLQDRSVHGILVLSVETLDSLIANTATMPHMPETSMLVSHARIAEAASVRGYRRVMVVPMGDDSLLQALHRIRPSLLSKTSG